MTMCVFVVCPDVIDSDPENKQATNNLSDPMLLIYNVCGATFFFPTHFKPVRRQKHVSHVNQS